MQIHELPEITSISSGGYLATDNGTQTTKIDYDELAKAIIEQYSGSTLAGAAQSVQAALGGLADGSTLLSYADATAILSGDDLDSYTEPGLLYAGSNSIASSLSHSPVSVAFKLEVEASSGGTGGAAAGRIQRLYPWNNLDVYQRRYGASSGWAAWEKLPTRAEVDALSSNMASITFTRMIATTSGTTATLPNNYRGILKTIDSSADRCGLYFVRTASNGSVNCTPVREATALTIDSSTANKLIVTSPGSSVCIFENITGKVTL